MNLNDVLKQIKKIDIKKCKSGNDFEQMIRKELLKNGFKEKKSCDKKLYNYINKEIKSSILKKTGSTLLSSKLSNLDNFFIYQPYGTHQFPDFLVFNNGKIFSIEAKSTTGESGHPVWNSNLPKSDCLYIFGSVKRNQITFFRGEDVLKENERIELWKAINDVIEYAKKRFSSIPKGEYGFTNYFRIAFLQAGKNCTLNFFTNLKRDKLEKSAIRWVKEKIVEE